MGLLLSLPTQDLVGISDFQANTLDSSDDGLTIARSNLYVLTGDTPFALSMPTGENGDVIKIKNLLDADVIVTLNTAEFDGVSQTVEIDTPQINFELIFTDTVANNGQGWIIL